MLVFVAMLARHRLIDVWVRWLCFFIFSADFSRSLCILNILYRFMLDYYDNSLLFYADSSFICVVDWIYRVYFLVQKRYCWIQCQPIASKMESHLLPILCTNKNVLCFWIELFVHGFSTWKLKSVKQIKFVLLTPEFISDEGIALKSRDPWNENKHLVYL